MTKKEAEQEFRSCFLDEIRREYGKNDKVAIRTGWNDFVDYLQKEGRITERQADTWSNPFD